MSDLEDSIKQRIQGTQALYTINLMGEQSTPEQTLVAEQAAQTKTIPELRQAAVQSTQPTQGMYQWLQRELIQPDPNFKPEDHTKELQDAGIPYELHSGFLSTNSMEEFQQYKTDLIKEQQNKQMLGAAGWKGIVADGLASLTDPVTLGSMFAFGLGTGIAQGAVQGAKFSVLTSGINAGVRPTGDWRDIPEAGLMGAIFGAGFNSLVAREGTMAMDATRTEFQGAKESWAGSIDPRDTGKPTQLYPENLFQEEGSIGAATATSSKVQGISPTTEQLIKSSKEYLRTTDWINKTEFRDTPEGTAAKKFYDVLVKTPLASDWDKLANSSGTIAAAMAHKLFESPSGIVRNNRSATMLKDLYENNLLDVNRVGTKMYSDYAKAQGKTFRDIEFHSTLRNQFDREVMLELNSRYHDGISNPTSSAEVKQFADSIDHYSGKAVQYMQGTGDEIALKGSEGLNPKEGWFRQIWRGDKVRDIMNKVSNGEQKVTQVIANSYKRIYNFDDETAILYAKAVIRRSMSQEEGINTNLINMLQQDGRQFLEKFLADNGIDPGKIKKLVDDLASKGAQRKQESFTKQRLDIDLREKIPGTNYSIIDLVDTDVQKVWSRYARGVSGASALARHGIQRADKKYIIDAIKQELAAKGDTSVPQNLLDNLFSHFESGPIGGGLSRTTVMAMRLTNLSTLNSLGLTQMAETGVMIGAVGWDAFKATAPLEIKAMLNGAKTPIISELERWTGPVGDSHLLHNDMYTFELMKQDASIPNELIRYTEAFISKGQRVQGYVSGFYAVHSLQQKIAVSSMVDKLAALMNRNINSAEARRLYDIGLDTVTSEKIQQYFKNIVEYDAQGKLVSLHLDQWNPVDRENFRLALNRHTYQTVQKAMAGEGSMWWHTNEGALFTHLKNFTLTTIQKQVLRNINLADPETKASVIYGLMTAGVAYTATQIAQGKKQNLTASRIIKGAIGMSNFTGFIPSFSDPIASILGMNDLRFNHYGMTDVSTGVLPVPVMFPTMNRLAHVPGALYGLAAGNYTKNDVSALRALPIIGNMPLVGAVWGNMYNENKGNSE